MITDLSLNGSFLGTSALPRGRAVPWRSGEKIAFGPFIMTMKMAGQEKKPVQIPSPTPPEETKETLGLSSLKKQIHRELLEQMDLRWIDHSNRDSQELFDEVFSKVHGLVFARSASLPQGIAGEELARQITNDVVGLGPLEDLLVDDEISEIMVVSASEVFVERKGQIERTNIAFTSSDVLMSVIERIVSPIGKRIDESSPMVDARLPDGSRVNAVIPSVALKGPCLTIRKFSREPLRAADLVRFGTVSKPMAQFLQCCVNGKKNVVISGGTGSGKTTLLNVLSGFIPKTERIVTIEDSAELRLTQDHVITLESKPPNIEGKGAITIRDLVKNALRMRPDRIVVGECRGGEALDMLQAMNTGHSGSLTTLHANSPAEAVSRLETMALMSGMDLPTRAIREQVSRAVNLIVQQSRFPDGSRKVTHISEVLGLDQDGYVKMENIFLFEQRGYDAQGRVRGELAATGYVPTFVEEFTRAGIAVPEGIFRV
ncbi:CpaF family protein [bacterium]|nr:CpaF family protein [bacterium]